MPTLSEQEVLAFLAQDDATIAFDTNAIFATKKASEEELDPFIRVCNHINEVNKLREKRGQRIIRKTLSSIVFNEKLHDLRQRFKTSYDHDKILGFLASKQIEILAFDQEHAVHVSEILWQRYPEKNTWKTFKQSRCARCLGLSQIPETATKNRTCGATVDWLIAGHADAERMLLVTDDGHEEFDAVQYKTRLQSLEGAVKALYSATAFGADGTHFAKFDTPD